MHLRFEYDRVDHFEGSVYKVTENEALTPDGRSRLIANLQFLEFWSESSPYLQLTVNGTTLWSIKWKEGDNKQASV